MHPYAHSQYNPDLRYKARRRDDDDDVHSMSSNETRSERRFSISTQNTASTISTAHTMDSDPGPGRSSRSMNLAAPGLLPPMRRSPSVSSFGGQSHLSANSHSSIHSRRDLGTAGSGTSSLDYGLVGRFQGLTAQESDSASGRGSTSPTGRDPHSANHSPFYPSQFSPRGTTSSSSPAAAPHGSHGGSQASIVLPPIQSFDHPPPTEFAFPTNNKAPRTTQSQNSNNSTISGNSYMNQQQQQQHYHSHAQHQHSNSQGLPFTQEMLMHQQQMKQQQQVQMQQQQQQQQQ